MADPDYDLPEEEIDFPDEEDLFLEENGMGADGKPMMLSDAAWNGEPWDPDVPRGVW